MFAFVTTNTEWPIIFNAKLAFMADIRRKYFIFIKSFFNVFEYYKNDISHVQDNFHFFLLLIKVKQVYLLRGNFGISVKNSLKYYDFIFHHYSLEIINVKTQFFIYLFNFFFMRIVC